MSDLYAGAYWGPRRESIDRCADRFIDCLAGIAKFGDVFAKWYEKGKSSRDARARIIDVQSRESVVRLLEKGRNRRDIDGSVIADLGFHLGVWNGAGRQRAASFSVTCGLYNQNPNLSNAVVLNLPEDLGELADKERCVELLAALVRAWEPEWAGVISTASRNSRPFRSPFVDWIVYVNRRVDRSKLPSAASVKVVDGLGTIILVQEHPIDPSNPMDIANVRMTELIVKQAQATTSAIN